MKIRKIRNYLFHLVVFSFLLLFMSGCAHRELTRNERKIIRSSFYMEGFIHGIYVGKNEDGNEEFKKFQKALKKVK